VSELSAKPDNHILGNDLVATGYGVLNSGTSGIAIYDINRRELMRLGSFVGEPDMAVDLGLDNLTTLLWARGFYLKTSMQLRDEHGVIGTLTLEEPVLHFALGADLGDTGDLRMCVPKLTHILCFPDRSHPQVYETSRKSSNGKPTAMSAAVSGKTGIFKGLDYRDINVVAAYGPLSNTGLGFVVKKSSEELMEPIREQFQWSIPMLLFLAAAGAL